MADSDVTRLPDGSGCFVDSFPLPKDHWLYKEVGEPPMPLQMGMSPERREHEQLLRAAAEYAVRSATRSGTISDFDPDALVQALLVGVFGYCTVDGTRDGELAGAPEAERRSPHQVTVTFACYGCMNSSSQPLTMPSLPSLQKQMANYAEFHGHREHHKGAARFSLEE